MKFINKFKSLNYNKRKSNKIEFIIIHYTAINNFLEAISHLCDKSKKVSSHYLITQNGDIYCLVDEKYRAWHAGVSIWKNYKDINSLSVGIELDFSFNGKNKRYSVKMINSLKKLIKYLLKKYDIKKENVLGHSDISPYRKIDPGKKFPWNKLSLVNLAFLPKKITNEKNRLVENYFDRNNIKTKKNKVLFMLNFIGYETKTSLSSDHLFKKLIKNYQRHFYQRKITGKLDNNTYERIKSHYLNLC